MMLPEAKRPRLESARTRIVYVVSKHVGSSIKVVQNRGKSLIGRSLEPPPPKDFQSKNHAQNRDMSDAA
jgi:hypothetical protein